MTSNMNTKIFCPLTALAGLILVVISYFLSGNLFHWLNILGILFIVANTYINYQFKDDKKKKIIIPIKGIIVIALIVALIMFW